MQIGGTNMKNIVKKLIPLTLALSLFSGSMAQAVSFPDMPQDYTKEALENAVSNGLLTGFPDGTIGPDKELTRAQIAAIISRSLGAEAEADLTRFTDVKAEDWFYKDFAKAVKMRAFNGDQLNHLNPDKSITFQECFKVVASVFGLIANTEADDEENDLLTQDLTVLDKFTDGTQVAEWAKPYVAAIVEGGYWQGIDSKLTPTANITRAQFALLMDNLVPNYIKTPGTYKELNPGNTMIKCEDVTLDGITTDDNIIIADGVKGTGNGIKFNNFTMKGKLVIRGGGKTTSFQGYLKESVLLSPYLDFAIDVSNLADTIGYSVYESSFYVFGG